MCIFYYYYIPALNLFIHYITNEVGATIIFILDEALEACRGNPTYPTHSAKMENLNPVKTGLNF